MKTILFFAIGLAIIVSCIALSCIECQPELCNDPGPCPFGETLDPCKCCPACYKGPGEKCGGPWNLDGVCAHHLFCAKLQGWNTPDPVKESDGVGICYHKK